MMATHYRTLLVSTLLCVVLFTSGCVGLSANDGPPSQYNVTFDKPTTGAVFSDLSLYRNT